MVLYNKKTYSISNRNIFCIHKFNAFILIIVNFINFKTKLRI